MRGLRRGDRVGPVASRSGPGRSSASPGLEGSGVDDIFHILFGLDKPTGGEIVYGHAAAPAAIALRGDQRGFALVPANRRDEGLMTAWSIRRNTSLAVLDKLLVALGIVDREGASGRWRATTCASSTSRPTSIDKRVLNLSGGNQQKVVRRQVAGDRSRRS